MIPELFAGPGGWTTGARIAGCTDVVVGIEHDRAACLTAVAAGHWRVQADVRTYPTAPFVGRVTGLLGSPPCTSFSSAGQGAGRQVIGILATAMTRILRGRPAIAWAERQAARVLRAHALVTMPKATRANRARWARDQARLAALVLQPARWIAALAPPWVALEQVPSVLPLWTHMASMLRERGYHAWAGVLSAEQYGVPQTRKRAILLASLDGPVGPPPPSHQPYRAGRSAAVDPDLFGDPLPPPVSMAQALGWDRAELVGFPRRADTASNKTAMAVELGGEEYRARDLRAADAPALALTEKVRSWERYTMRNSNQARATERELHEPAGTIFCSRLGNLRWHVSTGNNSRQAGGTTAMYERSVAAPSPTLTQGVNHWQVRPATTVQGDPRIWPPGHKVNASDRARHVDAEQRYGDRAGAGAVRVSVAEAGVLQSFPADYPWQGTRTAQFRQVGDAVPPLLAAAVLQPFVRTTA